MKCAIKTDSTHTAAVDPDYFWLPMSSCPVAKKVQLLTRGEVAVYGKITEADRTGPSYLGWAPLPKIRPSNF